MSLRQRDEPQATRLSDYRRRTRSELPRLAGARHATLRIACAALAGAYACFLHGPALADTLIDNIEGISIGRSVRLTASPRW